MDTLELMRTFVTVVDCMSFTSAGHRLRKSKALVSKHIGELEDRLGARLLNRTTRKMQVTEIGRAYFDRARTLLGELDALETSVRTDAGQPRGRLKITAPQTLGELEMMEMLTAFHIKYPEVDLEISLGDRMVDLVGEGFEVALRVTTMQDSGLITRKLSSVGLLLCASPGYIAARGSPRTPADLADHRCIVDLNIKWRDNWRFSDGQNATTLKVTPCLTVNSAAAVRQALLGGLGLGFAPEFVVARDLRAGRLVSVLEPLTVQQLGVYLVYPHRLHVSAKVRAFIDFVVAWYTPQPPWMKD